MKSIIKEKTEKEEIKLPCLMTPVSRDREEKNGFILLVTYIDNGSYHGILLKSPVKSDVGSATIKSIPLQPFECILELSN